MGDVAWVSDALIDAAARGVPAVLATVVRTEGSTYRRTGARMLFAGDGQVGAVSGGCLEADLALRAQATLDAGAPALVTYDTRSAEDLVWGLGLGCNGRVDVLLEPMDGERMMRASEIYARCRELEGEAALATVISVERLVAGVDDASHDVGRNRATLHPGDRVLLTGDGVAMAWGPALDTVPQALIDDLRTTRESGRSGPGRYEISVPPAEWNPGSAPAAHVAEVLLEALVPPVALLVCGAGPDAVPLVQFATALGWRVTVADDRPAHARSERFPGAQVQLLDPGEPATSRWSGGRRAAGVVMAHHYERDRAHLAGLLATDIPYVGVLGPRRRTDRLLADLNAVDTAPTRLFAPVGLDLGAETPEEIAISIVSEIAAVMGARPATPLRHRQGGIHERSEGVERPARAVALR